MRGLRLFSVRRLEKQATRLEKQIDKFGCECYNQSRIVDLR